MHIMRTKRVAYMVAFVVLGILLQQLVHAGIEMAVINLLVKDFEHYGLGLSWDNWYFIHGLGSILLIIGGIAIGWWGGIQSWRIVYVENGRFGRNSR